MVIILRLFLSESIEEDSFLCLYYQTIVCGYGVAHSLGREEGMCKGINVKCFKCINVNCFKIIKIKVTRCNCVYLFLYSLVFQPSLIEEGIICII